MNRFGECGLGFLGRNFKGTMVASCVITGIALIFFLVALAGNSSDNNIVKTSAWSTYSSGSDNYWGLKRFIVEDSNGGSSFSGSFEYGDSSCGVDYCSTCEKSGADNSNLLIVTVLITIVILLDSIFLCFRPTFGKFQKIFLSVLSFFAALLSLSAFANWSLQCHKKISETTDLNKDDLKYGPGYQLDVAGFVAILIQFIIFCLISTSAPK